MTNLVNFNAKRKYRTDRRIEEIKKYVNDYGSFERGEILHHFSKKWKVSEKTVALTLQYMVRKGMLKKYRIFARTAVMA